MYAGTEATAFFWGRLSSNLERHGVEGPLRRGPGPASAGCVAAGYRTAAREPAKPADKAGRGICGAGGLFPTRSAELPGRAVTPAATVA